MAAAAMGGVCSRLGTRCSLPALLDEIFFLAIASCSAICFSIYASRFRSISSCCRSPRIALVDSCCFFFCAAGPLPNQPHMVMVKGARVFA